MDDRNGTAESLPEIQKHVVAGAPYEPPRIEKTLTAEDLEQEARTQGALVTLISKQG